MLSSAASCAKRERVLCTWCWCGQVSSSLDGTVALWQWESDLHEWTLVDRQARVSGGPVFSLLACGASPGGLLAGLHNRSIVALQRDASGLFAPLPGERGGHTGWVRTLATWDRWLYR